MERSLLFGALALGCVGYLCGIALTSGKRDDGRTAWPAPAFAYTAMILPILVFLATLPSKPPYAAGHGFGSGFALGSLGAFLAAWLVFRARASDRETPLRGAILSAGPLSVAVAAAVSARIMLHPVIIDAMLGTAIGWFAATAILLSGRRDGIVARPLVSGTGFTALVCSLTALAAYRGGEEFASDKWSATGLALAAGVPFAVYLCSLTAPLFARIGLKTPFPRIFSWLTQHLVHTEDGRVAAARVWRSVAATVILLVLAKLLSTKALDQPHLFTSAAAGALAGWVCWWLAAVGRNSDSRHLVPLAVLLIFGVAIVAFNQLAGFGIAVAILSAWLAFAMAETFVVEGGEDSPESGHAYSRGLEGMLQLLFCGLGFVLYRVVTTRFSDDVRGVGLTDNYGMLGFLAGAALPPLLASILPRADGENRPGAARILTRLAAVGLLTLAAPGVAIVLWRSKVALALVAGLTLSSVVTLWSRERDDEYRADSLWQPFFALGVMLALGQWTHHAVGLASLTRDHKVNLVSWLVGGVIAAILILDMGGRLAAARAGRGVAGRADAAGGADR